MGTPFPEIGELDYSTLGMATAYRGEDRINWGLLRIADALSFALNSKKGLSLSISQTKLKAVATPGPISNH